MLVCVYVCFTCGYVYNSTQVGLIFLFASLRLKECVPALYTWIWVRGNSA